MKKCATCKLEKELEEFYNLSKSKDGKQQRCKICLSKANKESRAKKPKKEKIIVELNDSLKFCPACNTDKGIDLFYKNSKTKDGLFIKCKVCVDNKIPLPAPPPLVKNGRKIS